MILSRYERMIAKRYLLPGKGEGFIFLVASISLIAVMLGVAALIIVMSVMNGFRAELFDKIVGLNGHAVVQGYGGKLPDWRRIADETRRIPGVTSAVPLIEQPLMASSEGRVEGVLVRGMRSQDIVSNPESKISEAKLNKGGFQIYTTFDKDKINALEKTVEEVKKENLDPKSRKKDRHVQFGGASVKPGDGAIVAIYGGESAVTDSTSCPQPPSTISASGSALRTVRAKMSARLA